MSTSTSQRAKAGIAPVIKWLLVFLAGLFFIPLLLLAFLGYLSWFADDENFIRYQLQQRFYQATGKNLDVDGELDVRLERSPSLSATSIKITDGQGTQLLDASQVQVNAPGVKSLDLSVAKADTGKGEITGFNHRITLKNGSGLVQEGGFTLVELDPLHLYSQLQNDGKLVLPKLDVPSQRNVLKSLDGSINYQIRDNLLTLSLDKFRLDNSRFSGQFRYQLNSGEAYVDIDIDRLDVTGYAKLAEHMFPGNKAPAEKTSEPFAWLAELKAKGSIRIGVLIYGEQTLEKTIIAFE